jgi:ParB family chromosome partitioning protein
MINASPEIRTVKVSSLKPAPYNPRRIDPAAMAGLEKSLERFGVVEPIIFNERSGFVVGGHQRLKVLRRRKVREAQIVIVNLDEDDERALNLALNNPAIAGEFSDRLADLLAQMQAANSTLFADLRLDQLLAEADAKRRIFLTRDDLDDVPPLPKNPVTQSGDIWKLGRHRLICGDAANVDALSRVLDGVRVELLLTDPPYGVDYRKNRRHRAIAHDNRSDYQAWFRSWLSIIPWADYGAFYIFMSSQEMHNLRNAMDELGWKWHDMLLWVKNRPVLSRKNYNQLYEPIAFGEPPVETKYVKGIAIFGWPKRHRFYESNARTNVLEYDVPAKSELHPTMKPVRMLEQLLLDGSRNGGLVLDPFGGSGSTLIACESSERRCRMVELDPAYCDVIVERWRTITGGKAVRMAAAGAEAAHAGRKARQAPKHAIPAS